VHPYVATTLPEVIRKVLTEKPRDLGAHGRRLTPFFCALVHQLLSKNRRDRFSSAAELLTALEGGGKSTWWRGAPGRRPPVTEAPLRRLRVRREAALRGRDPDLASLHGLYREAAEGNGRVMLVHGEAGIGKTRLVDELVRGLRKDGEDLNFLFGSHPPGGAATATGAWAEAYGEHLGGAGADTWLRETRILVPAFDALLRGEPPPKGGEPLSRDSLQTVFVHATRALARERPTVVLIEDLHSAPDEGLALFAALALAIPGHRVLLIGTTRPGISEQWRAGLVRLEHASALGLERLALDDLGGLLADVLGSEELAEELSPQIATLTDGNPFFLFETVRGLEERRMIKKRDDGTWTTTGAIRQIELPDSLSELIGARIVDLTAEERGLLELAACCGFEFDPELVAEAAGMKAIPALRLFGHLERVRRLVRSRGDAFVFDHHQVREALRNGLSAPLRRRYHAVIAETIESRITASDGPVVVQLCRHLLEAERADRALPWLEPALDALERGPESGPAVALAERALKVEGLLRGRQRVEVLLRLADHLEFLGRREPERMVVEEAVDLARRSCDPELEARARAARGWLGMKTADYRGALAEFVRALDLAREVDNGPAELLAIGHLGVVLSRLGRYEEAREHLVRQLELARATGDRAAERGARCSLGLVLRRLGRLDGARSEIEMHLALAQEDGDRQGEATATGNLGLVFSSLGLADEALVHHRRHLRLAREIGDRPGEGVARGNVGLVLTNLGRFEEARESHERHLDLAREIGDRQGEATTRGNLAVVLSSLGLYAEGLDAFGAWLDLAREIGDRQGEAVALLNLGLLRIALGRTEPARRTFEEARALLEEIGAQNLAGYALQGLSSVAEQAGDEASALRLIEESLALRREIRDGPGISASLVGRARLLASRGAASEAIESIDEALSFALKTQRPDLILSAKVGKAVLAGGELGTALASLAEHGDRVSYADRMEAAYRLYAAANEPSLLETAWHLLCHLRENAPRESRKTMMENISLHRRIVTAWRRRAKLT